MLMAYYFGLGDLAMKSLNADASIEDIMKAQVDHCSALLKMTADGKEIFISHLSWTTFESMTRIWKMYDFDYKGANSQKIQMTSWPAQIYSGDDFYITSQNLTITETTHPVYNIQLYKDYL